MLPRVEDRSLKTEPDMGLPNKDEDSGRWKQPVYAAESKDGTARISARVTASPGTPV